MRDVSSPFAPAGAEQPGSECYRNGNAALPVFGKLIWKLESKVITFSSLLSARKETLKFLFDVMRAEDVQAAESRSGFSPETAAGAPGEIKTSTNLVKMLLSCETLYLQYIKLPLYTVLKPTAA